MFSHLAGLHALCAAAERHVRVVGRRRVLRAPRLEVRRDRLRAQPSQLSTVIRVDGVDDLVVGREQLPKIALNKLQ